MTPLPACVTHLEEDYRVYVTLVRGKDRAILWDTGQGKLDLRAWTEARGIGELLVLNSHGHADHIGGNHRFREVWLHEADRPLAEAHANLVHGGPPPYDLLPLEPGTRFDLGGLHTLVIPLTGHTRGSVGLLLEEHRLLLAGDGLNPTLLLLGPEAAPLSRLRESLEAALDLPFDRYLAGHAPHPLPRDRIRAHLEHLDHLRLEDPSRPGPYGPKIARSQYRSPWGPSVLWADRRLNDGESDLIP